MDADHPSKGGLFPRRITGLTDELREIGMFYADGGRIFGPLDWIPCNIFGRMVEGLETFAGACATIRAEGVKTLEIKRGVDA